MAQGYTVIEQGTFDGSSPSLTFTSIPQDYQHLEFSFSGISDQDSATRSYFYIQFNGDTGANYVSLGWSRESGSVGRDSNSGGTGPTGIGRIGGASNQANQSGFFRMYVYGYSNTTLNGKNWMCQSGNQDNSASNYDVQQLNGGVWRETDAVTELYVSCYTGDGTVIEDGSTYLLAGWT